MGLIKKGVSQKVLLIDNNCKSFEIKTLTKDGNLLKEILYDRAYTITEGPVTIKLSPTKSFTGYLVDKEKGTTVRIEKTEDLLKLSTNPKLISKVLDTSLLEQAFGLKPETKTLIIAFIFGAIIGYMF